MRKVSKACVDLIKSFEGLHLKAYYDSVQIPTIGYGTIVYRGGKKVKIDDPPITEQQAIEELTYEVEKKAAGVEKVVTVPLNDNEFGALVSFAYNVGSDALAKSTLLKKLNAEDRAGAADEFLRWNKAGGKELPGLTRRRKAERELFLKPVEGTISNVLPEGPSDEDINVTLEEIEKEALKK